MSDTINTNTGKKKRPYNLITPDVIAAHKAQVFVTGNNTSAVIAQSGDVYSQASKRGNDIVKKSNSINAIEYVDNRLQEGAVMAINRVIEMTQSENEGIATKNSHFVIDHIRGKAVQRTDNRNINISIESILE